MVVCFSCGVETKAQLDRLVATSHYQDYSEAIAAAVQNLTVIHSELKDEKSIVIDRTFLATGGEGGVSASAEKGHLPTATTRQSFSSAAIPKLLHRPADPTPPAQFADFKAERTSPGKPVPVEDWIFGQYNRLLPIKVTCRALINHAPHGGRLPLEKLSKEIANEAAKFGRYLSGLDEERHLGRDDAMVVAFPKHSGEFKSIQRFANQFVGSANKEGDLSGLPASLHLIGHDPEFPKAIALTNAGWTFGQMTNPLLDDLPASKTQKFSDEELTFLLDHIIAAVPIEAFAYRTILDAIARGICTPDTLDTELSKLSARHKQPGNPFVSTQRSGAICRMADLDLIGRSRTATRVSYVISPRGQEFLQNAKLTSSEASKSSNRS